MACGDGPGFMPGGMTYAGLPAIGFPNSSLALGTGEAPMTPPGEAQFVTVAGDVTGDSSLFIDALVKPGGAIASAPACDFFMWPKCFSSIFRRPSLVKGLGRTSFMP